ncbi:MAG: hypothetical protein SH856_02775 [Flavobacteriales bacterium]|nr:hypothetical protein [Flavobacteriales bacterium]
MYKYKATPSTIASFFDFSILQAGDNQTVLGGLLLANASVQADYGTREITANTPVTVVNNGTGLAKLGFGFSRDIASTTAITIDLLAGESNEMTAQELGFGEEFIVLMVINQTAQNTEWQVIIG